MKFSNLLIAAPLCLALSVLPTHASARGFLGLFGSSEPTPSSTPPVVPEKATPAPAARPQTVPAALPAVPSDLEGAIAQAQAARRAGDLAGANRILSQLVLFAPDDPRVLSEYGKTLTAQARSDDALAFLERAIQLQPSEWSFYSAQGVAYDQKADYKSAQASYARALSLKPGEPTVLNNAALSHIQSGDLEGAEKLLQLASAASKDNPRITQTMALVQSLKAKRPTRSIAPQVPAAAPPAPPAASVATVTTAPVASTPLPSPPIETQAANAPETQPVPAPMPEPMPAAKVEATPEPSPAPSGVAALMSDPTVRMQTVPKDDPAPAATRPATPKAAVAPAQKAAGAPAPKKPAPTAKPPAEKLASAAAPAAKAETPSRGRLCDRRARRQDSRHIGQHGRSRDRGHGGWTLRLSRPHRAVPGRSSGELGNGSRALAGPPGSQAGDRVTGSLPEIAKPKLAGEPLRIVPLYGGRSDPPFETPRVAPAVEQATRSPVLNEPSSQSLVPRNGRGEHAATAIRNIGFCARDFRDSRHRR